MDKEVKRVSGSDRVGVTDSFGAFLSREVALTEKQRVLGHFDVECVGPAETMRDQYVSLAAHRQRLQAQQPILLPSPAIDDIARFLGLPVTRVFRQIFQPGYCDGLLHDLEEPKWSEHFKNLVTDEGANFLLDTFWAGAGYTATFYMGLISSINFTTVANSNTAAQINAGNQWREAGPANAPNYSQGARPAMAFSAAAGRSKSLQSPCVFSMSQIGTIKGAFTASNSTKQGTTGKLVSAGLFASGDRSVGVGDTINASYTSTAV